MTVSDLIFILQAENPHAIVMLVDPERPPLIAKLGVGEVQPVQLVAKAPRTNVTR